jgi:hypothetical protein
MRKIKLFEELNESGTTRISLTEEDFKTLISGGIVSNENEVGAGANVEIALQDIGFDRMQEIINQAKK